MAQINSIFALAFLGCVAALPLGTQSNVAHAQDNDAFAPPAEAANTPQLTEEEIRRELDKWNDLEITQRKDKARQLIAKYPNTRTARLVQRYLEELELYDEAAQAQRDIAAARAARVREYWRQRVAAELSTVPNYQTLPLVRLTNKADQAVLFQLRGYGMGWTRPRLLLAGASETVNYPVEYRRITTAGTTTYLLQPGNEFVFRQSKPDEMPRLYEAAAAQ
ncbi:hypothetical protein Mal52_28510 [Symmachiella dynata]|uniref:Uncharacterized protein n=1 Tax=Symmachiella dynata TaxID=2527995 RepID=A0A517ZPM3_9PLAN|nr:hypothetical protein [Symmachiella dynata]QDU44370.1 hypothetical protein Mal52_28510 [Symmachiella dynata]